MNKYISKELIVFVFPIMVSLFAFSSVSLYQNYKLSKQTTKSILDFDKNLKEKLGKLIKYEEFSKEAIEKSENRRQLESKIFTTLGSKKAITEDSLNQIPSEISKLKLELFQDLGKLKQFVKIKDELSYTDYEDVRSLLNSEIVLISNLEEYLQFIISKSKLSDENIFRKCESSYLELHSNTIAMNRFVDIKEDIDNERLKAKEINDNYWAEIDELDILIMLSILGIVISSIFMILLIWATIKYNLFGENASQKHREEKQISQKKREFSRKYRK